jgi:hypothetical protein
MGDLVIFTVIDVIGKVAFAVHTTFPGNLWDSLGIPCVSC